MAYPATAAEAHETAYPSGGVWRWLTTTNHREIGLLYITFSFTSFFVGGIFALLMRTELAYPGQQVIGDDLFNRLFSTHGTTMIFLFIIPVLVGFGNYFVPLMIGAKDMAYPRINALGFWLIPPAAILIWIGAPAVGWTYYAPLTSKDISPGIDVDLGLLGLILIGTSSILGGINFLVTIFKMRAPGVKFSNMPLFVWGMLVTSAMVVLATPVLASALGMAFLDRNLGTCFFPTVVGACGSATVDPILWQHLFWFYSHPAVYIMVIPAMGIISEVLPAMAGKPIFGYKAIAYSSVAIGFLGFGVWAHHMFTTGISTELRIPFMLVTVIIAIPSGVKIFNWTATLWRGRILIEAPTLFALAFIGLFTIGGISGVYNASIPVDYQLQDTYWVVAHLHYVLFGGSVMGVFAGAYFWYPYITRRMYDRNLAWAHFILTVVGMNLTFFTMHYLGLMGMPRRIADYRTEFAGLNLLASLGSGILGLGQLVFAYNMIVSRHKGKVVEKPMLVYGVPADADAVPR
ncbi:MAG TPA: cbb3-type cytochrome c oxidase subunit I [Thermoplasmata archaeon]|nr:cbb3-type cytochrome c oxidase subunit I [Thermoplasmata archaeon]